ncbi:XRE family transcriptional regulator [Mesorhizobium sp. CU2]|uniref:helix-turn-helix domain-containing protein n=1 Tax=unclassified Mesorhizobium TaxID=325217 RepID=UPI00112EDDD3|nr:MULTISPECIES: XRE family transcriptional regulator [unclassified Mesorhizobium]TPN86607.1 XRE family transcriptional regulator [Mesorhizobium sp. CU3]TPO20459.1 XRE family transcriptional regulator [Mesorhizobium sp. CU2]
MALPKLYLGRKIRELRQSIGLTQLQFAERLGISTSYLNQIENNQRPVSASVLLALADKFQIDLAELSQGEGDRLLSALIEALADPLFEGYAPNLQEMKLIAGNAPGLAKALISCHQAYRRSSEQLASFDASAAHAAAEPSPYEEVRDFFHFVDNYIHDLDTAAERLAAKIGIADRETGAALSQHLEREHGVRIARATEPDLIRRFDPMAKVLYLNPYLPAATRNFQIAFQVAEIEAGDEADRIAGRADFRSPGAFEICRVGLCNYFAGALTLPYQRFLSAAKELRHDLELLAARFGASIEQVAHRLSTLQRPGSKGVPVFFARIDRAGNITKRHSAAKLQFARFGGACPLWNVHQAFESPGRFLRQLAETPDGVRYLSVATELTKSGGGFNAARRRYAIALGCEIAHAGDFVYADGLDITSRAGFDPIGISCRICIRSDCVHRSVPPLTHKITVDRQRREAVPYQIA